MVVFPAAVYEAHAVVVFGHHLLARLVGVVMRVVWNGHDCVWNVDT